MRLPGSWMEVQPEKPSKTARTLAVCSTPRPQPTYPAEIYIMEFVEGPLKIPKFTFCSRSILLFAFHQSSLYHTLCYCERKSPAFVVYILTDEKDL